MAKVERNFIKILTQRFKEKNPLIQTLMGPRQVGKTTGVFQFLEKYKGKYHYCSTDDIIAGDRSWLIEQWQTAITMGEKTLLVIDEIQKIQHWSETIKQLWDEQKRKKTNIKLLLLGSSSLSLSKGISESLAGRFETIPVYHWDYVESKKLGDFDLETYLHYGGYPKSYDYFKDEQRWYDYIRNSIVDRVIDKDILQFASIKNPALFRQAFEILCCYPSQEISFTKILGQLQDKGNVELVKHYISLFEGAYLLKALYKYTNQEFKVKSSSPKILLLSPCFYQAVTVNNDKMDFVFESTVGAKLLQISSDLYYWRQGNDEVDFVLKWRNRLLAIEVKSGKKRRIGGMDAFMKLHPKAIPIIISRTNYQSFISNPIKFLERLST